MYNVEFEVSSAMSLKRNVLKFTIKGLDCTNSICNYFSNAYFKKHRSDTFLLNSKSFQ